MNYFELYDLPIHCAVDKSLLKRTYYLLSKKYHPDFFEESTTLTEAENLTISAKVNEGYTLLQKPHQTLGYILHLKNIVQKEEKYQLPTTFLMEVMELNETLNSEDTAAINDLMQQIEQPVQALLQLPNMENVTQEEWQQLKDYYYKWKYLDRLLQRANGVNEFD
jgi:molecular chaperone HscB